MKVIRHRFPKIRTYVRRRKRRYEVDARGFGIGRRFYFTDKRLAFKKAAHLASQAHTASTKHDDTPTRRTTAPNGFSVDEVVQRIVTLLRNPPPPKSPPVPDLLKQWVEFKANDKLKPIRQRTLASLRHKAARFETMFGSLQLHEITTAKIESTFGTLNAAPLTYAHSLANENLSPSTPARTGWRSPVSIGTREYRAPCSIVRG